MLKIDIAIADHTTLSRRDERIHRTEPLPLEVNSTGLTIDGEGAWRDHKYAIRSRRKWRKRPLGVDADTPEIIAAVLTPDDVGDISQWSDLLDRISANVASMVADGAYDGQLLYEAVTERHTQAAVIVPPRRTAVAGETTAAQRNNHLTTSAKLWSHKLRL